MLQSNVCTTPRGGTNRLRWPDESRAGRHRLYRCIMEQYLCEAGQRLQKPDAITVFHHENYRNLIWPLPVGDLLHVGPSTERKLRNMAVFTIGDLAHVDLRYTRPVLGKIADILYGFANGLNTTPVAHIGDTSPIKSIGNVRFALWV